MNVRHNPYLAIAECIHRQQLLNLLDSRILNIVSEYLHVMSFNSLHIIFFLNSGAKLRQTCFKMRYKRKEIIDWSGVRFEK